MKVAVVVVTVFAVCFSKSVTLLKRSELTEELINNPRYLLWETEEGLYEVEDLQSNETEKVRIFASGNDVCFYIYTPANPVRGVQIRESQIDDLVELSGFDINRPTLVVIHGWRNHYESPVNDYIKNDALAFNEVNVVVADWSPIAKKNYITAQRSVLAIGNYIGDFLIKMNDQLNHRIEHVTIVGHSLGAHIAGNVGARTNGLIETIIGLDPAGPLFSKNNINNRLDPTDGKYVHVIHTNTAILGWSLAMGHVDYYPNGGSFQPGCGTDITGSCSHGRAYEYFAESFENNRFAARSCDSYKNYEKNICGANDGSLMGGYPITKSNPGAYYLNTNREYPYAQG